METNNKLATEWLTNTFSKHLIDCIEGRITSEEMATLLQSTKDMAMQMERRNIEIAWHDGSMLGRNGWVLEEYSTGKEYAERTYKTDDSSSL